MMEYMPATFNKLGISFQYPENWTLDEEDAVAGERSVTVYSPGAAFWSITVHPRAAEPTKLAKAAAKAIQEEYEGVESEEVAETIDGREMVGYDLSFFYLDLTNTASVRCVRTALATYTVFFQAEDREFEQVGMVFRAMTTSFVRGLKGLRG
jgi:hypothetical protein